MLPVLLYLLLTVTLLLLLYCLMQEWKYRSIRHLPGPKRIPILGNLLQLLQINDLLETCNQQIQTYGPISVFRIGPIYTWLLIADREMAEFFLRSPKYITKSYNYKYVRPWLGNGLLTVTGPYWHTLRKLILPAFFAKPLQEYIHVFNSATDTLIEILQNHVDKDAFNIWNYITCLTLDIACDTTMGVKLNAQKYPEGEYIKAIHCVSKIVVERALSPWKSFDCLFWFSRDYTKQKNALKIIHGLTNDVIQNRRKFLLENNQLSPNTDLESNKIVIDLLLKTTVNGQPVTQEELKNMVTAVIFAGHDTTASAISLLIFELAKQPQIQDKIVDELHEIFGNETNRPVTYQDLCNMKYTEAVIKESMRCQAPVPIIGRELTEDVEYKGTILPKGLSLAFYIYGTHRSSNIYEDPDTFKPERFLTDNIIKPGTFLPFSTGPRNCLGQKYAMYELKVVIAKLLRHFEFVGAGPEHNIKPSADMVLKSLNGVMISLKRRRF